MRGQTRTRNTASAPQPQQPQQPQAVSVQSGCTRVAITARTVTIAVEKLDHGDGASGAARRRREGRLRSWWKREQQSVRAAVVSALHHSCGAGPAQHQAPQGHSPTGTVHNSPWRQGIRVCPSSRLWREISNHGNPIPSFHSKPNHEVFQRYLFQALPPPDDRTTTDCCTRTLSAKKRRGQVALSMSCLVLRRSGNS